MTTIISTDARIAQSNVKASSEAIASSVNNLVTGRRLDANVADFSVGSILTSQVGVLRTAILNAGQAQSLLETAKGALIGISDLLNQQKNLAIKSSDDSLSDNERGFLNQEFQALSNEIDRIAATTEFNGKTLIDGSISGVAGVDSSTGLATENFSLVDAKSVQGTGTIADGSLINTQAVLGENNITFGANSGGAGSIAVTLDTDLLLGAAAAQTITVADVADGDAASVAAAVVAGINTQVQADIDAGTTSLSNFRNFDFIDNGDGTVTVRAKEEAGDQLNNVGFAIANTTVNSTAVIGNNGSTTNIVGATQSAEQVFTQNATTATTGSNGIFKSVAANNIAETRTSFILAVDDVNNSAADARIRITDEAGTLVADFTSTAVGVTNYTTSAIAGELAGDLVTDINANAQDITSLFTVVDNNDGTITFTANEANLDVNRYSVQVTGTDVIGEINSIDTSTAQQLDNATLTSANVTLATTKSVGVADLTVDNRLLGSITNLQGTFNSSVNANGNNTAVFTAEVNGVQYTSQEVFLRAPTGTSDYDVIAAGTVLTFQSASGPTDSSGNFTNSGFQLTLGTSDVTLGDVTSAAAGQQSLDTVVTNLQTQLDGLTIAQDRSLNLTQIEPGNSDHRITGAVGTILDGLRGFDSTGTNRLSYNEGDIRLISDLYGDSGTNGDVTSFTVDRLTDTISTTINGETFTAYLNSANAPTTGGVRAFGTDLDAGTNNGSYNPTTKILSLGSATLGESAKLNFFSADINDGRVLQIDLGNVATNITQIDISSNEGETALASALNAVFDVSANDSLSFQVGADSTNSIGVSIGSAQTTSLYVDADGVAQSISIGTLADAQEASDILDTAINNVISLIADVDAAISSFDSAISNNNSSLQNADAARSVLLDTDYSQESTTFAEARVRVDAATAVLTQLNSRIQNLLQLLQQ